MRGWEVKDIEAAEKSKILGPALKLADEGRDARKSGSGTTVKSNPFW